MWELEPNPKLLEFLAHAELVEAPKLVHFVGSNKPWEGNVLPFSNLWNEYRSRLEGLLQAL